MVVLCAKLAHILQNMHACGMLSTGGVALSMRAGTETLRVPLTLAFPLPCPGARRTFLGSGRGCRERLHSGRGPGYVNCAAMDRLRRHVPPVVPGCALAQRSGATRDVVSPPRATPGTRG
jgi:hypothetical protein